MLEGEISNYLKAQAISGYRLSRGKDLGGACLMNGKVRRAKERSKSHLGDVPDYCRECILKEIEQAIAEQHPELKRGDVFELVQEWLRTVDEHFH
jgi:hypothetical protein